MKDHEVPLLRIPVRSPRSVLLLHPFQLPLVLALVGVSVVFTVWPEVLDHAPVSFEQRGLIHHVWHYTLLGSSVLVLIGMMAGSPRRLQAELVGICLLAAALAVNLTAIVAGFITGSDEGATGLGVALRAAVIFGLLVRGWTLVAEPTVTLTRTED